MPKKSSDDLSRKGEPSEETKKGLKVPVPKRSEFDRLLSRAVSGKRSAEPQDPSESDQGKRRTSRDQ